MDHKKILPSEVDRPGSGSPERFVERLNRQLRKIGIKVETLPKKSSPAGGPPCFRMVGASYRAWLEQASVSYETVPYRLTMPAEPNYCRDCTPTFHREMVAVKACIFPDTVFEEAKVLGEPEIVGAERSQTVAPQSYPMYALLTYNRRGP